MENAMIDGWILRRRAQIFRGSTSKIAQFFAVLFSRGAIIVLGGLIYLILVFLHQHHSHLVPPLAYRWLGEELEGFPYVSDFFWIVILFIVLNLYLSLRTLRKSFTYKEREPVQ